MWRLLVALAATAPSVVSAQEAPAVSIPSTREYGIRSGINGRGYRLFVSLPERYAADDTTRYPVLYLLDGNGGFPLAVGAHRTLRIFGEVPEVIVVGVGYDARSFMDTFAPRWADYTPSPDSAADAGAARQFLADRPAETLRSGGAPAFLRVLRQEVIPLVDARLRTTGDRGLWGHSLGGLFALYALFEQPALFARYAISSPSLSWNHREPGAREAAYARAHTSLPARVFLSVGAEEAADERRLFDGFVATLRGRRHRGLDLTSHVFAGETHASVVPASVSRGLRVLYPPARRP